MVKQVHFVPGAILHYHVTGDRDAYGEILVLGTCLDGNLVLILRNPFPPTTPIAYSAWPAIPGQVLTWHNLNTDNSPVYHPASECDQYWKTA